MVAMGDGDGGWGKGRNGERGKNASKSVGLSNFIGL